MYVLAAKFAGNDAVQYFVATTQKPLKSIMRDADDWRLWHNGWCNAKTPESWKLSSGFVGEKLTYVI